MKLNRNEIDRRILEVMYGEYFRNDKEFINYGGAIKAREKAKTLTLDELIKATDIESGEVMERDIIIFNGNLIDCLHYLNEEEISQYIIDNECGLMNAISVELHNTILSWYDDELGDSEDE